MYQKTSKRRGRNAARLVADANVLRAAALPVATEQLALIAALGQRADDARTPRLAVPAVRLERESEVLSDEFRARNTALAGSSGEQPILLRSERNRDGLLPGACHGSNVTQQGTEVKATQAPQQPSVANRPTSPAGGVRVPSGGRIKCYLVW